MIYLNIGSNLQSVYGDRFKNINKTIDLIKCLRVGIKAVSSTYETPSYPCKKYPKFLNLCLKIDTNMSVVKLFNQLKLIEKKLGRLRSFKNAPRICDIDIIDFKGIIFNSSNLIIPHPRLHIRNFVLYPLKDVEPNWHHPIMKKNLNYFINQLSLISRVEITRLNKNVIINHD